MALRSWVQQAGRQHDGTDAVDEQQQLWSDESGSAQQQHGCPHTTSGFAANRSKASTADMTLTVCMRIGLNSRFMLVSGQDEDRTPKRIASRFGDRRRIIGRQRAELEEN